MKAIAPHKGLDAGAGRRGLSLEGRRHGSGILCREAGAGGHGDGRGAERRDAGPARQEGHRSVDGTRWTLMIVLKLGRPADVRTWAFFWEGLRPGRRRLLQRHGQLRHVHGKRDV